MKKFLLAMLLLFAATSLFGCGNDDEIFQAASINPGVDRCEHCNMLVQDDHNATQVILNDGRSLKFDDLGCMVEWTNENGLDNVNVRYVRDFNASAWIVMENATYVYHPDFQTPMAYGVYSFEKLEEAEAFIKEHGKGEILSYDDLKNHTWERNKEMNGHDHGGEDGEMNDHNEDE